MGRMGSRWAIPIESPAPQSVAGLTVPMQPPLRASVSLRRVEGLLPEPSGANVPHDLARAPLCLPQALR